MHKAFSGRLMVYDLLIIVKDHVSKECSSLFFPDHTSSDAVPVSCTLISFLAHSVLLTSAARPEPTVEHSIVARIQQAQSIYRLSPEPFSLTSDETLKMRFRPKGKP